MLPCAEPDPVPLCYACDLWNRGVPIGPKSKNQDILYILKHLHDITRTKSITVTHVLAHSLDGDDQNERERRQKENKKRFGDRADEIVDGNRKADELAKKGQKGMWIKIPPVPNMIQNG